MWPSPSSRWSHGGSHVTKLRHLRSEWFLPRCMECRCRLAMRILSVRPYVCQTYGCDTSGEKSVYIVYDTKDHLAYFLKKRTIGGSDPFFRKLWVTDRVRAKWPIVDLFILVTPQPQHLVKKVQLTLGTPLRAFQWAKMIKVSNKLQSGQHLNNKLR